MGSETKPFSAVLATLADEGQPIDAATIYGLSGLERDQIMQLGKAWSAYSSERRLKLIQSLNQISETNFEMDFRAINHIALEDPASEVRRHAVEGLWEDETIAFMHKLIHILEHDISMDVRSAAVIELGRFILLGEYEDITHSEALMAQEAVLRVLQSNEDIELRRRALEAIANCSREGVADFIEEFYASTDLPQRMSAIFAMGRTCDSRWAPEVLEELNGDQLELQYEAARAAGHLELAEAVPHIVRLIEETEDSEILEVAIWALGEIGGDEARRVLTNIITRAEAEDDEEILEAAQDALDAASLPGDFLLFDFEP
jgi:HEAT repeat protein